MEHPVIIAGFGRFGQIVGRLLHGHGIGTTILEQDASQIEMLRKYGYQVFYGDASRLDLLHAAGAHKAKLLVLSLNDPATSLEVIEMVKSTSRTSEYWPVPRTDPMPTDPAPRDRQRAPAKPWDRPWILGRSTHPLGVQGQSGLACGTDVQAV